MSRKHPDMTTGRLVDLVVQLRRDEALPEDRVRERDRLIGRALDAPESVPADQRPRWVAAWLGRLGAEAGTASADDAWRGGEVVGGLTAAVVVVGLLLGYGSAMGLFYYDGSQPVNVVRIVGVYVGLNLVTLALLVWAALPGGLGGTWVRRLSPGRWVAALAGWWAGRGGSRGGKRGGAGGGQGAEIIEAVRAVLGRAGAHQTLYGRVQKWQVLSWSQALALAFNVGALAGACSLIVLSDLAFGWSTTLGVEAGVVHGITGWLSLPWAWLGDAGGPDEALVSATQTYRAAWADRQTSPAEAARWWPFVMGCLVVYGVLPRVVTLVLSRWRLARAVAGATVWTPGVDRLCGRMGAAVVSTRGVRPEVADQAGQREAVEVAEAGEGVACWVRWASAPLPAGVDPEAVIDAGGVEFAADREAVETARRRVRGEGPNPRTSETDEGRETKIEIENAGGDEGGDERGGEGGAVRVVVRAWEPPMLELLDFIEDLRGAVGPGVMLEVQPVGPGDRGVWRKRLAATGDPWVRWVEGGRAVADTGNAASVADSTEASGPVDPERGDGPGGDDAARWRQEVGGE